MSYSGGVHLPYLKAWMMVRHLTTRGLAESANLPVSTIQRARRGGGVHVDTMYLLIKGLRITEWQLRTLNPPVPEKPKPYSAPLYQHILSVLRDHPGDWLTSGMIYHELRTRKIIEPRMYIRTYLKNLVSAELVQAKKYEQRWRYTLSMPGNRETRVSADSEGR